MFATACKKEEKEKVFSLVKEEIEKLKHDLTKEEIKNVLPMLEYFEERQINVENDVGEFIDSVIYKQDYIQTKEFLKLVEQVKVADIKKLISKLFIDTNEVRGILE
jgi:predicted Zn-dependent peptidase